MITGVVGVPFEALVSGAPAGLVGVITVEVYDPSTGLAVLAPTTVGITEPRPRTYRTMLTVPVAGSLMSRWETPDGHSAEEEVIITAAAPVLPPVVGVYPWAPTVAQVAAVTPSYTRGGFDDDRDSAGATLGTYTIDTVPTLEDVEALIATACDEVAGRVEVAIPARCYALAGTTAKWHVAAAIAAGKQSGNTEDASGEYRGHITNFRACLDALVLAARRPAATRLA